jgi:ComEC/Rec2-related protein
MSWLKIKSLPPHETFFWAAFFFLAGTLAASATVNFPSTLMRAEFIGIAATLILITLQWLKKPYAPLALVLLLGGIYCITYDLHRQAERITFGHETKIEGIILQAEQHLDYQELRLANNIVITADRYPAFAYGDRIRLTGTVRRSKSPLVRGYVTAHHTNIKIIGRHEGSVIKEYLYAFKSAFENNLKKVLPSEKAAFLSGLTVGSTAEFTKNFLVDLRTTGTTHLVALSGSNVSGIISMLMLALTWFLPRKKTFWPALFVITLFVVMTGAEASLVRAAIMNGIVLAGSYYERTGSMRNAIIAAAFIMALWNPLVPAFDLGFQLSFAAILGMAYLQPVITRYSPLKNKELMTAIAAQAAVMPVLAITVGHANLFSIIPNMLIAIAIPATVGLGFLTGTLGFASTTLAFAPAWIVNVLLSYEMGVVHLFARYM